MVGGVLMRDDLPATMLLEAAVVDDPYAFYRRLVAGRMAGLRPEIESLTAARYDEVMSRQRVEFMETIANAIPIRVVSKLIGFHDEDPDELLDAAFASTAMLAATESLDEISTAM